MHLNCKQDEKLIKYIIHRYISLNDPNKLLQFISTGKSLKYLYLITANNTEPQKYHYVKNNADYAFSSLLPPGRLYLQH